MNLYEQGINDQLRPVCSLFDRFCRERNIPFYILTDQAKTQNYLIRHSKSDIIPELLEGLIPKLKDNKVYLLIDPNRDDGISMTFSTVSNKVITCDGHWDPIPNHPGGLGGSGKTDKNYRFTIFVKRPSKKRLKKMGLSNEDQYKYSRRKRLRDQSMFPSSFGKSVSFGGRGKELKEDVSDENKRFEANFLKAAEPLCTTYWLEEEDLPENIVPGKNFGYTSPASWAEIKSAYMEFKAGNLKYKFSKGVNKVLEDNLFAAAISKVLSEMEVGTFEPTEKEILVEIVILMDHYGKMTDNKEPADEIWSKLLEKVDNFRNSAISESAMSWSQDFYDAVSTWTPDDKFNEPFNAGWKIDPEQFNSLYDSAISSVGDDSRLADVIADPWSYNPPQAKDTVVDYEQSSPEDELAKANNAVPIGLSRNTMGRASGTFPGLTSGHFGMQ